MEELSAPLHLPSAIFNVWTMEQNLTTKCMYDNNYDREKCILVFDNYTECRRFWKYVSWDRWFNGIVPNLPIPEERERVKKEYIVSILFAPTSMRDIPEFFNFPMLNKCYGLCVVSKKKMHTTRC
ncbi:uncharacterized protein LOC135847667 isoform X2 [Planococcus citri]|uniref:uncharacterized protein LOC135847667 isoform X2 n=1 Tax=Planococcus citri TaxID=170843 RepID=UPI0031F807CF